VALPVVAGVCKAALVTLVAAVIGMGAWHGYKRLVRLPYFSVKDVRVEGNLQVASEDIAVMLGSIRGASLLELDLAEMSRRVRQHPWIQDAWVQRQLPLSLIIHVVERVPEAVFVADRRYLLSADGVILASLTDDELPTLPVLRAAKPMRVRVGERVVTAQVAQGLAVWRQFQVANTLPGGRAHEITMVGDGSYLLNLGQQMPAIRLKAQELPEQFRRLGAALAASGQALANFSHVDLRFRDRVVFTVARGR
jgi:cell division protein FtsQ